MLPGHEFKGTVRAEVKDGVCAEDLREGREGGRKRSDIPKSKRSVWDGLRIHTAPPSLPPSLLLPYLLEVGVVSSKAVVRGSGLGEEQAHGVAFVPEGGLDAW